MQHRNTTVVTLLIVLILLLDQAVKFYIKTNFEYNEDLPILGLNWARLHFVENEGMAFGFTFDWPYGKLMLSLFRIGMVLALIVYLRLLIRDNFPLGLILSIGMITAGALGNIIDSAVYGMIFTESPYHGGVAELVAWGQGYGTFLHGKVVDMLYFPITWISVPAWIPYLGGQEYLFFSPIFNVADAAITSGVIIILVFQQRFFNMMQEAVESPMTDTATQQDATP
jgi:signal peptidase II